MSMTVYGLFIGLVANAVIDVAAVVLKSGFGLPSANWAMVGRWVGHLPRGRLVHQDIGAAAPVSGELALGWATHYAIAVLYGIGYLWLVVKAAGWAPSLASAIAFSVMLLAAPWLILQPGLGLGAFASRAANPWRVRAVNVFMHVMFGAGLYLGWWIVEASAFPN